MTNAAGKTALVIGATGGIGGEVARSLLAHGWHVRALHRRPEQAAATAGLPAAVAWVAGDAMDGEAVLAAATGADVIVHAANPPGYRNWKGLALPMLDHSIAAAEAAGARLVLPGTVYNFGPDAWPRLGEDSPQHPRTRKGAIRVEMERRIEAAAGRGRMRALIVRAGDFFGPRATANSWFAQIVKPGRPLAAVTYPGRRDAGHAWAYLPDLAETMVRLVEREAELPAFARFHFRGHWFEHGVDLADAVRRVGGRPAAPIRRFPWVAVYAGAPFVTLFRELLEMRYLWKEPLALDNARLVAFLGEEPHTPLDKALRATMAGLGAMPAAA
ncbi:MAG TPA: SDR family NAD(P)-dependent oxidoreductase [Hyphomicrobiales bacterium]|nr:SDR family NAD(P)-dependent oxidoreductase [Hyphomicrobiales bacterium]